MTRRHIPAIGMFPYGRDPLRAQGIVVMPYEESMRREPARMHPHYHDFFQVSLLRGAGRLMHDFREKDVRGTTLFFLSPGQVHTVSLARKMTGIIVSFTREFFDGAPEQPSTLLLDLPFYLAADVHPWLELSTGESRGFEVLFSELQEEYDRGAPGADEILRALLRVLFVRAARLHVLRHPSQRPVRASALARAFQLAVEKHFRDQPTLAPYARELGVTVNHLNEVVSSVTGRPAGEHIRLRRLLAAKRQLLHSDLDVAEIGYLLGFKDPSYFGRFFLRCAGLTPAAFRAQSREKYQREAG